MPNFVCIREFEHRHDAGRAQSLLQARAIEAVLLHDDAGGWDGTFPAVPAWARARLLVSHEDVARANEALGPERTPPHSDSRQDALTTKDALTTSKRAPWAIRFFLPCMLVGYLVGIGVGIKAGNAGVGMSVGMFVGSLVGLFGLPAELRRRRQESEQT